MATISDERLAEMIGSVRSGETGGDRRLWNADNRMLPFKADTLEAVLTELQSLRSQAGVNEAVANGTDVKRLIDAVYIATDVRISEKMAKSLASAICPTPIEITEAAERAFKDGLAYGSNVRNADPDIAWGHSAIRAALQGETK